MESLQKKSERTHVYRPDQRQQQGRREDSDEPVVGREQREALGGLALLAGLELGRGHRGHRRGHRGRRDGRHGRTLRSRFDGLAHGRQRRSPARVGGFRLPLLLPQVLRQFFIGRAQLLPLGLKDGIGLVSRTGLALQQGEILLHERPVELLQCHSRRHSQSRVAFRQFGFVHGWAP